MLIAAPLVYVEIDQGIHCYKSKVTRNEKNYLGFLIPKKWQIFEAFH